ncbi:MAG: hypothetical protein ABSC48_02140 [Terracidiphilus sp.]|jgi:hypothetical protein
MELALNLVWALLAFVLVRLWLRHEHGERATMRTQAAALAMLIVILLPVISVTDDLQALQNPAELDCCARRNHAVSCPHSPFPPAATPPPPVLAELSFGFLSFAASRPAPAPLVETPALASIQNRPPPAA